MVNEGPGPRSSFRVMKDYFSKTTSLTGIFLPFFCVSSFCLFRAAPAQHMEVPRLGVESEL